MDTAGIVSPADRFPQSAGGATPARWWQRGVIYQIYPRSFADGDGDGIGDLRGIIGKVDYLAWLGVDAVWLSPIYPSPMADFGYDVADYTSIHPLFGTWRDFDELSDALHRRGIKLILDFVPNHTSDQHPWFLESRASRANPKRDWYIWRDPAPDGGPPNNWMSTFGGSAWEWDARTGQYYYHAYLKQQPDVNWRNPALRDAMHQAMRFWLDRGVDGFRMDVIWHLVKDEQFRCNPPNPDYHPGLWPSRRFLSTYTADRPEVHDIIAEMRRVVDEYDDRLLIGEIYLPVDRLVAYYGTGGTGLHLPFNFQLVELPWRAEAIAAAVDQYEKALPPHGWPNWVLGNHDKPRIASRAGGAQAGVAAVLLLTLRGTPTLYYGDEIGMSNVPIPEDRVQDPWERTMPGFGVGRDPARTPMQWDASLHAGFTSGEPWLPVGEDSARINVALQREDPASLLRLYRRLIQLRRAEPVLVLGDYRRLPSSPEVFLFLRRLGDRRCLVALNFSADRQPLSVPPELASARITVSTRLEREGAVVGSSARLEPNEGFISIGTAA
ncbi:alpha-amylase family glycosyl hydrolase [Nitrospira moscoviensis]|uniref:Oligo-1,6-glucosidase n=1 Tax=Nitrospira moscoviensis TaxID=42253 RepID=A0A0K2GF87_NITMO|nr:alpha-amylase family glycosyl hydrolase [Nitrospira moscoviensis]ALA59267.1 Oligo-1,6-glucosidase [Nitrospira moscoviensis]